MNHQMKKAPALSAAARQMGLTLIELTIVLLILIGLSGLLLPFVQGFIDKTHDSANTDSLKEVSKQIDSYNNLYSGYPEDMESLIVGTVGVQTNATATAGQTAVGVGAVVDSMMNATLFSPYTLAGTGAGMQATADMDQFLNAGISKVKTMWEDPGQGNHTLKATDATLAVADGIVVATINKTRLTDEFTTCSGAGAGNGVLTIPAVGAAADASSAIADQCLAELLSKPVADIDVINNQYVVLGIGNEASLVGRTMAEAPIHFAKVGGMNAANKYNHILAVFELQEKTMANGHPALVFMGTLMPMMKLEGIAQAQGSYYAGDGA